MSTEEIKYCPKDFELQSRNILTKRSMSLQLEHILHTTAMSEDVSADDYIIFKNGKYVFGILPKDITERIKIRSIWEHNAPKSAKYVSLQFNIDPGITEMFIEDVASDENIMESYFSGFMDAQVVNLAEQGMKPIYAVVHLTEEGIHAPHVHILADIATPNMRILQELPLPVKTNTSSPANSKSAESTSIKINSDSAEPINLSAKATKQADNRVTEPEDPISEALAKSEEVLNQPSTSEGAVKPSVRPDFGASASIQPSLFDTIVDDEDTNDQTKSATFPTYKSTDFDEPEIHKFPEINFVHYDLLLKSRLKDTEEIECGFIICEDTRTTFRPLPKLKTDRANIRKEWKDTALKYKKFVHLKYNVVADGAVTFTEVILSDMKHAENYFAAFMSDKIESLKKQGMKPVYAVAHLSETTEDGTPIPYIHILATPSSASSQDMAAKEACAEEPDSDPTAPDPTPASDTPKDKEKMESSKSEPPVESNSNSIEAELNETKRKLAEAIETIDSQMQDIAKIDALQQELTAAKQGVITLSEARTAETAGYWRTQIQSVDRMIELAQQQADQTGDVIEKTNRLIEQLNNTVVKCYDVVNETKRITDEMTPAKKPEKQSPVKYYLIQLPAFYIKKLSKEAWVKLFVWVVLLSFLAISVLLNFSQYRQNTRLHELNQVYRVSELKLKTLKEIGKKDEALMEQLMRVDLYYTDPEYFHNKILKDKIDE